MTDPTPDAADPLDFRSLPQVAAVETDRFCRKCGYNLRTQAVRRDLRTDMLLCRCPECGTFDDPALATSAGRVWLKQFGSAILTFYVLGVLFSWFWIGVGLCALAYANVDDMTTWIEVPTTGPNAPPWIGMISPQQRQSLSGKPPPMIYVRVPESPDQLRFDEVHAYRLGSMAVGLGAGMLLVTFCYHWRKWVYYVAAAGTALLACGGAWAIWSFECRHLARWAAPLVVIHGVLQVATLWIGVTVGRPVVRTVLRIVLPPRARQVLAFLWFADGKRPPATTGPRL